MYLLSHQHLLNLDYLQSAITRNIHYGGVALTASQVSKVTDVCLHIIIIIGMQVLSLAHKRNSGTQNFLVSITPTNNFLYLHEENDNYLLRYRRFRSYDLSCKECLRLIYCKASLKFNLALGYNFPG